MAHGWQHTLLLMLFSCSFQMAFRLEHPSAMYHRTVTGQDQILKQDLILCYYAVSTAQHILLPAVETLYLKLTTMCAKCKEGD